LSHVKSGEKTGVGQLAALEVWLVSVRQYTLRGLAQYAIVHPVW
jgi:hypothetical protein